MIEILTHKVEIAFHKVEYVTLIKFNINARVSKLNILYGEPGTREAWILIGVGWGYGCFLVNVKDSLMLPKL